MNKKIFQREIEDWDRNARFYLDEAQSPFKVILRREFKEKFLLIGKKLRILDLGAGAGDFADELVQEGHSVICVDFSEKMREAAFRNYPGITYVLASAHELPFSDRYFDAVIAGGILHHLKIQELLPRSMEEIRRVLKSGGIFAYLDRSNSKAAEMYEAILHAIKVGFTRLKGGYAASSSSSETSLTNDDLMLVRRGFLQISRKPSYAMPFKLLMVISNTFYYMFGKNAYKVFQYLTYPPAFLFEKYLNFTFWETEYCEVLKKKADYE